MHTRYDGFADALEQCGLDSVGSVHAVLFDLDGVLTKTAGVHAAAWKKLFDGFLEQHAAATGEAFVPFDIDADYRRYVDGKARYEAAGVSAYNASVLTAERVRSRESRIPAVRSSSRPARRATPHIRSFPDSLRPVQRSAGSTPSAPRLSISSAPLTMRSMADFPRSPFWN